MEHLKTFEDACKVEGLDAEKTIPDFSCLPEQDRKAIVAIVKLIIIIRAANRVANKGKEWIPDWNNTSEYKWYPWFYMGGSSGFRFHVCVDWIAHSDVGSRLCFISEEVADLTGNQFIELYKDFMTIQP